MNLEKQLDEYMNLSIDELNVELLKVRSIIQDYTTRYQITFGSGTTPDGRNYKDSILEYGEKEILLEIIIEGKTNLV